MLRTRMSIDIKLADIKFKTDIDQFNYFQAVIPNLTFDYLVEARDVNTFCSIFSTG